MANYHQANKERINKQIAKYQKSNKDKVAARKASYYQDNKEKIARSCAKYYQANKDERVRQSVEYTRARRNNDPLFKLQHNTRSLIWHSLARGGYTKKSKTATILGCTYDQFMVHLGPKPCDNPVLDHVCPMAQARTEDEAIRLNHYSNFQWLTPEDNLSKSAKQTDEGLFLCRLLLGRDWID
jgi:hypothetical protein